MSTCNILRVRFRCPWCECEAQMEMEIFFGFGNLIEYGIGDRVEWHEGRTVQKGGRPPNGDLDGEGYSVCPHCRHDFFVVVKIRGDIIMEVIYDPSREPYIREPG